MQELLPAIPRSLSVSFGLLVAAVVVALAVATYTHARRIGYPGAGARSLCSDLLLALVVWLAATGFLAFHGFFLNFSSIPPRVMFVVVPAMIAVIVIAFSKRMSEFLDALPLTWLMGFQVFRIAVEILLWQLAEAGVAPRLMTWEGRNFDVVIGVTAPLVAWLVAGTPSKSRLRVAAWWNLLGLLLLANVVIHGLLSAPTPFRVFMEEPANTFIARFPFIWLPALLVPVAVLGHLLSLRVIAKMRR